MSKRAFIFPGQASQYVGMGLDLYEQLRTARRIYDRADELVPFDLKSLSFEGPEERLTQTQYTQPTVFVHSVAAAELLKEQWVAPDAVAGHSLGEYAALVIAGVLGFEDALQAVCVRASLMQKAGEQHPGTMAAIIGLSDEAVRTICEAASTEEDRVCPANFNAPGQVVVSGTIPAVHRAMEQAKEAGAKLAVKLSVSGAFHSPLMDSVGRKMEEALSGIAFSPAQIPIVDNVTADVVRDPDKIRDLLIQQLTHPVLWVASMQKLVAMGIGTVIEVGPGKVLQGLMRRIDRSVRTLGADRAEEVQNTVENSGSS
ncbi:MAG: ACP S-malonyltransferase [Candidatus Latescibacteria bacterium]|nr:ACP S-malonyltransferase [Candidatus Latescibacterota bacterium]